MTRIIGGAAGGRRLTTPKGDTTRPTSDRVREALFSALESELGSWDGLRVLDLYAGSGAVGLEALSRGAGEVVLVEHDRRAASVAASNLRTVGLPGGRVVTSAVERFVAQQAPVAFDVAFLDPPYFLPGDEVSGVLASLADGGWLADDAVVVVERSSREVGLSWPSGFAETRQRTYGETALVFGWWGGLR